MKKDPRFGDTQIALLQCMPVFGGIREDILRFITQELAGTRVFLEHRHTGDCFGEKDLEQLALIYMNMGREVSRRLRKADERLFQAKVEAVLIGQDYVFKSV